MRNKHKANHEQFTSAPYASHYKGDKHEDHPVVNSLHRAVEEPCRKPYMKCTASEKQSSDKHSDTNKDLGYHVLSQTTSQALENIKLPN
jgi:hypothetical protein